MTNRGGRRLRVAAVLMGLVLLVAACGSDDKKASGNAASSGSGGASKAGALEGVKGTTPLVDLPADFKTKLDGQGLDNAGTYNYGAESYDAVIVIALAADAAKSDGIDMAKQINAVTRGGTKCTTYKQCSDLIAGGTTDIDYDGQSGPLEFSGNGEPTVASYGIQTFGADNRIDDAKTEFKTRIDELRRTMRESLERESTTEIDRMVRSINGAFEPYQRFYATESEKIEAFATKLNEIDRAAGEIRSSVDRL